MANKLGSNPSSAGFKPPSGREHPPMGGGKASSIGGVHCAGPQTNHGGDSGGNMGNVAPRSRPK
jgi:hypothetical protein